MDHGAEARGRGGEGADRQVCRFEMSQSDRAMGSVEEVQRQMMEHREYGGATLWEPRERLRLLGSPHVQRGL